MNVKGIIEEDFVNYKQPCMFISMCKCDWKCCKEANIPITICQNCSLAQSNTIEISADEIFHRYIDNSISEAVVIGGLEPLLQWREICELIEYFRKHNCNDYFVIYTGYYPNEIVEQISEIKSFKNIVMKFGRYVPNNKPHYDEVLGINLASDNQYGKVVC